MSDARDPTSWRILALVPRAEASDNDGSAAIAAAAALADPTLGFDVVFSGIATHDRVADIARSAGAARTFAVTHADFEGGDTTERLLALCEQALARAGVARRERVLILLPAGAVPEEIAARLAVRFDGCALGRCSELRVDREAVHAARSAYGARARMRLTATAGPCFANVRRWPAPLPEGAARGLIERVVLAAALPLRAPVFTAELAERKRPLEGASIVVSGGRGMQGDAGFALLAEVAERLDAALGGSLPAVDSGWVPVARQVGQSGSYVTPRVYVAVGISGTTQHLAGIGPDTRIVAINRDPEADIFRVASVGVVGEWETLLPALVAALPARREGES